MKRNSKRPSIFVRFAWAALLAGAVAVSAYSLLRDKETSVDWPYNQSAAEEVTLSSAFELVDIAFLEESKPVPVGVLGDYIYVQLEEHTVRAKVPYPSTGIISDLMQFTSADVKIFENTDYKVTWGDRFFQLLPVIVMVCLLLFIMMRGASRSLGLSSAFEVVEVSDLKEGFDDVAGIENARSDIEQIVQFLKEPKAISALGGRMPRGALFAGPPGTGKTLLARALAKEAGVPFLTIDASAVNQLFVGAGSMKLRSAFKAARKLGNCIVFIDEIDALGRARSSSGGPGSGASDEKETTLNTLLVEMDGFDARNGIFVVAATNRPDILDPALTRAGRFDRRVDVTLPDVRGREAILEVHMKKLTLSPAVSAEQLARTTYGMSGADLALLCNEASINAAVRRASIVEMEDFQKARDTRLVGRASSNRILGPKERRITAYHEAGHAFIACIREHADPVEKATIVPTGSALGYVLQMPADDHLLDTIASLRARIDVAVAGRVAEEIFLGKDSITNGAASDITQATRIARAMVENWGMSEKGFIAIGDNFDPLHDGETTTAGEVKRIIGEAISRVRADMEKSSDAIERIADALLLRETVQADEIRQIIHNFA